MAQLAFDSLMASAQDGLDLLVWESMARSRAAGLDAAAAAQRAMQAVRTERPDLTPDEARALVELAGPAPPCRAA
jgi:hypothetical protein